MGGFLDGILNLPPIWMYVLVGLVVFAEDAIFVGFFVPGETAAVLAGVASSIGGANLVLSIVVVVLVSRAGSSF